MSGNDSFTKVLLHFDGPNFSTVINDCAAGAPLHTWTNHNGSISTSPYWVFGGACYDCGLAQGWVDTPASADFTLGSGDFTVDFWFNSTGGNGTNRYLAGQANSGAGDLSWYIVQDTTNVVYAIWSTTGAPTNASNATAAITSIGWHHVAFVRFGNVVQFYLDGVKQGGDTAFSGTLWNSSSNLAIGTLGGYVAHPFYGYIDEFRLSVGIARWTANFTLPTAEYTQDGSISYFGAGSLSVSAQTIIYVLSGSFAGSGLLAANAVILERDYATFSGIGSLLMTTTLNAAIEAAFVSSGHMCAQAIVRLGPKGAKTNSVVPGSGVASNRIIQAAQ